MLFSINTKLVIAFDECNHGSDPEFIVGAVSDNIDDIIKRIKPLRKANDQEYDIANFLEERDFVYFPIPRKDTKNINDDVVKIIVYSEMINHYGNIETAILDGDVRKETIRKIKEKLHNRVDIIAKAEADIYYPLVNCAHKIAHRLYKAHNYPETYAIANVNLEDHKLLIHNKVKEYLKNFIKH